MFQRLLVTNGSFCFIFLFFSSFILSTLHTTRWYIFFFSACYACRPLPFDVCRNETTYRNRKDVGPGKMSPVAQAFKSPNICPHPTFFSVARDVLGAISTRSGVAVVGGGVASGPPVVPQHREERHFDAKDTNKYFLENRNIVGPEKVPSYPGIPKVPTYFRIRYHVI